jgi:hypothetical protein
METGLKVDLSLVNAKEPLRALADVTLQLPDGELTIRRCPVFEKAGQPAWASLPRLPFDKNGERKYAPLIDLPRELKTRILDAILAEFRTRCDAR